MRGIIARPTTGLDAERAEVVHRTPDGGFVVRLLDPHGLGWRAGDEVTLQPGAFFVTDPALPPGWAYDPLVRFPLGIRVEVLDAGGDMAVRGVAGLVGAQGRVVGYMTAPHLTDVLDGLPPIQVWVEFAGGPTSKALFWPDELEYLTETPSA